MLSGLLMVCMFLVALFLILLVLVQRGRGGGLAGAFGGMGGQSAFGTKAGDLFTRITIVTAGIWILLCVLGVKVFNAEDAFDSSFGSAVKMPATMPGREAPAGGTSTEGGPVIPAGTTGESTSPSADSSSAAPAATEPAATAPAGEAAPAAPASDSAPPAEAPQ